MDNSEKESIVNKINLLSDKRESLNSEIKSLGQQAKVDLTIDFQTFQQQMRIVEAAEEQLNESKMKLKLLNDEKLNKLRLVQINTYYNKRYDALGDMVKYIILFLVIAIIFAIVIQKGFIPGNIGSLILTIYVALGLVYFYLYYLDIQSRSKRNFDEYEWIFDPNRETKEDEDKDSGEGDAYLGVNKKNTDECVGEDCCTDGMKYDETIQQCVTEEGMSNALTQNVFSSKNVVIDYNNKNNNSIQPFSNSNDNFASF